MPAFKHKVHVIQEGAKVWETQVRLPAAINKRLGANEHIVQVLYIDGSWWIFTETFGLDRRPDEGGDSGQGNTGGAS